MEAKHADGPATQLNTSVHSLLAALFDVAQERIRHNYNGECPDTGHMEWRDQDCPACQVLLRVEAFLSTTAKIEDEASGLIATIHRLTAERDALVARLAGMESGEPIGYMSDEDLASLREKDVGAPPIWPRESERNRNPLYIRTTDHPEKSKA
jgi:hypothetical protein